MKFLIFLEKIDEKYNNIIEIINKMIIKINKIQKYLNIMNKMRNRLKDNNFNFYKIHFLS